MRKDGGDNVTLIGYSTHILKEELYYKPKLILYEKCPNYIQYKSHFEIYLMLCDVCSSIIKKDIYFIPLRKNS